MNIKEDSFAGLAKECKVIREKVKYKNVFENGYDKYYLSSKNVPFVGYFQGYFIQIQQKNKRIKETNKLRANCKNYLEIYRDDNELI